MEGYNFTPTSRNQVVTCVSQSCNLVPIRHNSLRHTRALSPLDSVSVPVTTWSVFYASSTSRGVLERLCCWEAAFWHPTSRYGAVLAPHIALESEPPCLSTGFTGNKGVNVISLRIDVLRGPRLVGGTME